LSLVRDLDELSANLDDRETSERPRHELRRALEPLEATIRSVDRLVDAVPRGQIDFSFRARHLLTPRNPSENRSTALPAGPRPYCYVDEAICKRLFLQDFFSSSLRWCHTLRERKMLPHRELATRGKRLGAPEGPAPAPETRAHPPGGAGR